MQDEPCIAIEDLFIYECEAAQHTSTKSAGWWIQVHSCQEKLVCIDCLWDWTRHVRKMIDDNGSTICPMCHTRFALMHDITIWRPI